MGRETFDLRVYRKGTLIADFRADGDTDDTESLRKLLVGAIRRDGWDESRIDEFEMQVRPANDRRLITTFIAT